MNRFTAFFCAALSYPKKSVEGLPWLDTHTPSQPGGWFHDRVDEWVENIRDNTRLWACFLAFVILIEGLIILFLAAYGVLK